MTSTEPLRRAAARGRRVVRPSGDDREAAILATSEALLAERPWSTVSVDDLARGAGISRPTFYFYFASKDAVLLTLLDGVIAEADAASAAAFAAEAATADRRRTWREGITAYFETFRAHRALTLAAAEAQATNAEVRALWARGFEGWVETCASAIEAERRRGAAPAGPPARDLAIALNAMNERSMYATFSGDATALGEDVIVDVLLEVWLRAVYGPAAPPPPAG